MLVSAFPCGPDSMTDDAIVRCIQGKPIFNLTIDAQSGTAGLETRVESFIDILRYQKKGATSMARDDRAPGRRIPRPGAPAPFREAPQRGSAAHRRGEARGVRVVVGGERGPFKLLPPAKKERRARDRHARTRVAFFRYSYYDIAFKFFVEHVLDADFVALPKPTKRTIELGSRHSSDLVCAPFKHILGDYIEALELGADVLVQFAGPAGWATTASCRNPSCAIWATSSRC